MRSIKTTTPAANRPEISAINKIWRAESLYIKLFPLYEKIDFWWVANIGFWMLSER
jgi:hypothetical protein